MTAEQTPDEWLLAEYDRIEYAPHYDTVFTRPMFQVLNDHPSAECRPDEDGDCLDAADLAAWPAPSDHDRIEAA